MTLAADWAVKHTNNTKLQQELQQEIWKESLPFLALWVKQKFS